jgi:hypothetical protein
MLNKYKQNNGLLCPQCNKDTVDTEGFDIVDLDVWRKMHCTSCKSEWHEVYALDDVDFKVVKGKAVNEMNEWLYGKSVVTFEWPYRLDPKSISGVQMGPDYHGKAWWDESPLHNKPCAFMDYEEDLEGHTDKGPCRFNRVEYSYYPDEVEYEALRETGVPEDLIQQFRKAVNRTKVRCYILEVNPDNGAIGFIEKRHPYEHLYKEEKRTGNLFIYIVDSGLHGDGFCCEDRDDIRAWLYKQDITENVLDKVENLITNYFWLKEGNITRYADMAGNHSYKLTRGYYYPVFELDWKEKIHDSIIAVKLPNGNIARHSVFDFEYDPEVVDLDYWGDAKAVIYRRSIAEVRNVDQIIGKLQLRILSEDKLKIHNVSMRVCKAVHNIIEGDNDSIFYCDLNGYVLCVKHGDGADKGNDNEVLRFKTNEAFMDINNNDIYNYPLGSLDNPISIRHFDRVGAGYKELPAYNTYKGNKINNACNVYLLAKAFAYKLSREINDVEKLAEIRKKNKSDEYRGSGCCPSHEYVDTNEIFAQAFKKEFYIDFEVGNEDHIEVFNKAWDLMRYYDYEYTKVPDVRNRSRYKPDLQKSVHNTPLIDILRAALYACQEYSDNAYLTSSPDLVIHESINEIFEYLDSIDGEDKAVIHKPAEAKENIPSFDEWRSGRRICANDNEIYGNIGTVFRYGDDSDDIAIDNDQFWLLIGNQEWYSNDLLELEIKLYLWRYVD